MRRAAAAAASLLLLGACAGTPAANTEPEPGDTIVELIGLEFAPREVTVAVGTRVVWRWTDRVVHNVISDDAAFASSKNLAGGSYVIRFDKAGTYPYQCTLHDGMRGTVIAR